MVRKSTACKECRMHRRKCIRSSLHEICDRCKHFGRDCSFPGEMMTEADDDELEQLIKEANELKLIINQLENEMELIKKGQQREIVYLPEQTSSSNNSWKLTIQKGKLTIETGIRSISDLLQSQPIRYLSPRLSSDQSNQDLVVHFNIGKAVRLRILSTKLLAKCLNPKPSPTALLLPTSFLFDTKAIIDQLIHVYFKCHNILEPMVHEPSFMEHYKQLDSPIDSLICVSICCFMCSMPCIHITHTLEELRHVGDYFAGIAKSKIMDQFDLPEKRLENMIAINLLGIYLYTVLNMSDNLMLATIGFQICQDLKPWYDKESQKPGLPSVECVLFSRHYSIMMSHSRLYEVIFNNSQQTDKMKHLDWKYLPDEPIETIDSINAINLHYKLTSHPIMAKIRHYRHYFNKEAVHSIKFSDIILIEDIVSDWWNKLPSRYRISENWLDTQRLKAEIDKSTDNISLTLLAYFLSYMNDIYATLLTPNDADFILSFVQEQALDRCIHCSQLTVYALHRLSKVESPSPCKLCHYMLSAYECLSHTLDVLSILSASFNTTIREEAKSMLSICMNTIDDMEIVRNHRVDPLRSPLLTGMKGRDFSNVNPSEYYNYPQPWYAAMYDICHYLEKAHITNDVPTVSSTSFLELDE